MLNIAVNPYSEILKTLLSDFRAIKWEFPFILQTIHSLITFVLLFVLLILYATLGFISQISNTFWDYLVSIGNKMSYSNPIQTVFHAISATLYFVLFLPFFIIQIPFWFSGWLTAKIGFRAFIILLITFLTTFAIYFLKPDIAKSSFNEVAKIHESLKVKYFGSDSLITNKDEAVYKEKEIK